jgi:hypothetical protein
MTDDRWPRVKELFEVAADLPLSERSAFLLSEVAGDDVLRQEVEALLAADGGGALSGHWPVASESLLVELRSATQPTAHPRRPRVSWSDLRQPCG